MVVFSKEILQPEIMCLVIKEFTLRPANPMTLTWVYHHLERFIKVLKDCNKPDGILHMYIIIHITMTA